MKIILASQSPRRRELLSRMGVEFKVQPSEYEEVHDENRSVVDVVKELSLGKAMEVATQNPDALVIGSDTIVALDGRQLGKPATSEEAIEMLLSMSDRYHEVMTGVALVDLSRGVKLVETDVTRVLFKQLTEQEVQNYVATGDPMDKAGSYGIQSKGGFLVKEYEGDIDTVIGFPTRLVARMLGEVGVKAVPVTLYRDGQISV